MPLFCSIGTVRASQVVWAIGIQSIVRCVGSAQKREMLIIFRNVKDWFFHVKNQIDLVH
jgi:hypothetical protein